jgi:hypothetical protein
VLFNVGRFSKPGRKSEPPSRAAAKLEPGRALDREAWISGAVAAGFVPAADGAMLRPLTATIASGNGSRSTDDVQTITGVPPTSFADFAKRSAQAWTTEAAR